MKQIIVLLLIAIVFAGDDRQILTKDQWVNYLVTLANRKSKYSNVYPYNVLYFDGTYWYADCVNLNKALFNGRNINNFKVGDYQGYLGNTGDITCEEMIQKCSDVRTDFTRLKLGEPRILFLDEHIGAYLGKVIDGKFNVVEATGNAKLGKKIAFSWVDSDGTRRTQKAGTYLGKWIKHGKPSRWVSY